MLGSSTAPDRSSARDGVELCVAFRNLNNVGIRNGISWLNTQPVASPVNASPWSSRNITHDSGASVVRYSFTARDSHPLFLAGLPAHLKMPGWGNGRE